MISIMFWVIVGLVLLAAEMLTFTFVLVFFGLGALLVALAKWAFNLESMPIEILLFAAMSVGGLLLLRGKLCSSWSSRGSAGVAIDEGKVIFLTREVPAKGRAEIEYQGTVWTAENESDVHLPKGARAVIVRTDGLTLVIKGA